MQMEVDYPVEQAPVDGPIKMTTRSQAQRQFGQNITNIAQGNNRYVRQKRRLETDDEERPLKKRRQVVDVDGDVDMAAQGTEANETAQPEGEPEVHPWDQADVENELACIEYVNDIMTAMRAQETRCHNADDFMRIQTDINSRMRTILLDWLVEVNLKFKLRDSSFYLAVNLLDRYLAQRQVDRSKLQLTGCACLWIAAKYHEIYAPEMGDFVYMSDNAFRKEDLLQTESDICKALNFNLTVPTPLAFAERYLKIAQFGLTKKQSDFLSNFSYYLIEHSLMNYDLCRQLPSVVAAACIAFSALVARLPIWDEVMEKQTSYSLEDLLPVLEQLKEVITNPRCKHRAVRKKYSQSRHGKVEGVVKKYADHFDMPKLIRASRKPSQ